MDGGDGCITTWMLGNATVKMVKMVYFMFLNFTIEKCGCQKSEVDEQHSTAQPHFPAGSHDSEHLWRVLLLYLINSNLSGSVFSSYLPYPLSLIFLSLSPPSLHSRDSSPTRFPTDLLTWCSCLCLDCWPSDMLLPICDFLPQAQHKFPLLPWACTVILDSALCPGPLCIWAGSVWLLH